MYSALRRHETIFALSSGIGRCAVLSHSDLRASIAPNFELHDVEPCMAPRGATRHRPGSGKRRDHRSRLSDMVPCCEIVLPAKDLLELQLHGSRAIIAKVFSVLRRMPGVRAAEPGEFSRGCWKMASSHHRNRSASRPYRCGYRGAKKTGHSRKKRPPSRFWRGPKRRIDRFDGHWRLRSISP